MCYAWNAIKNRKWLNWGIWKVKTVKKNIMKQWMIDVNIYVYKFAFLAVNFIIAVLIYTSLFMFSLTV